MPATGAHTGGEYATPHSRLRVTLPNTSSPISSRNVAGAEAAFLKETTIAALDCFKRRAKVESE
jgi:hypothetical protein